MSPAGYCKKQKTESAHPHFHVLYLQLDQLTQICWHMLKCHKQQAAQKQQVLESR